MSLDGLDRVEEKALLCRAALVVKGHNDDFILTFTFEFFRKSLIVHSEALQVQRGQNPLNSHHILDYGRVSIEFRGLDFEVILANGVTDSFKRQKPQILHWVRHHMSEVQNVIYCVDDVLLGDVELVFGGFVLDQIVLPSRGFVVDDLQNVVIQLHIDMLGELLLQLVEERLDLFGNFFDGELEVLLVEGRHSILQFQETTPQ